MKKIVNLDKVVDMYDMEELEQSMMQDEYYDADAELFDVERWDGDEDEGIVYDTEA